MALLWIRLCEKPNTKENHNQYFHLTNKQQHFVSSIPFAFSAVNFLQTLFFCYTLLSLILFTYISPDTESIEFGDKAICSAAWIVFWFSKVIFDIYSLTCIVCTFVSSYVRFNFVSHSSKNECDGFWQLYVLFELHISSVAFLHIFFLRIIGIFIFTKYFLF